LEANKGNLIIILCVGALPDQSFIFHDLNYDVRVCEEAAGKKFKDDDIS
jgi:hypothetical protein